MKSIIVRVFTLSILLWGITTCLGQTVSDEARRHFDRGAAAVEIAKSPADYEVAIKEFQQAISLASGWADAYFNLGKVQEQAEKFADAIASLKEYLRLAPNASDADEVKSLINKIEFKAENFLTPADISAVFASLSKWEAKGNCTESPAAFRFITPKSEGFINVLELSDEDHGFNKSFQTVKVEGTTVKYRWTVMGHCQGGCDFSFGNTLEEEIEVLSRTRVKVREVIVWAGVVTRFGRLGQRYECELSPPKFAAQEEFENKGGWWEGQNENGSATIIDGKYFIEAKKAGAGWNVTKEVSIDTKRDFSIESQLRFVSGTENSPFGVIWGRQDTNNFHFFGVTANGYYGYTKLVNGAWSDIVSARTSQVIQKGSAVNKLMIRKRSGKLEFLINGELVDSAPFQDFAGAIGFNLTNSMKIEIEYLRILYE